MLDGDMNIFLPAFCPVTCEYSLRPNLLFAATRRLSTLSLGVLLCVSSIVASLELAALLLDIAFDSLGPEHPIKLSRIKANIPASLIAFFPVHILLISI